MNTLETMRARQARDRRIPRQSASAAKPHLVAAALAAKAASAPPPEPLAKSVRQREDAAINRAKSTKRGQAWTEAELAVVADRSLSAREVSKILGRSMCAVNNQRRGSR